MEKYLPTNVSVTGRIKQKFTSILPRKFHCYCLGAEKTGTTTIHHMFDKKHRSCHEPEVCSTTGLVIDYLEGIITKNEVAEILKTRDELLNLEMESAHHLIYVSDVLVEVFPDAKFIVTVREPYSYLSSRLNWYLKHSLDGTVWEHYIQYFLKDNHHGYDAEEEPLKELHLYSLDTLLSQYGDHYSRVLNTIPSERCHFIKTNDLNQSKEALSDFLQIKKKSLVTSHAEKNTTKVNILAKLDERYVRKKIWEHCSEIVKQHFPEEIKFYSDVKV